MREVVAAGDFEVGNFTREMLSMPYPGFRVASMLENAQAGLVRARNHPIL